MDSGDLKGALARHGLYILLAVCVAAVAWLLFYRPPSGVVRVEAEDFSFAPGDWVFLEDVNFSGSRGIVTLKETRASARFEVPDEGNYFVWLRYFGNYADNDLELWRRAYTNNFSYIDYFGADEPQRMKVAVDSGDPVTVLQGGSHRYRWARVPAGGLAGGEHTVTVWKSGPAAPPAGGGVNVDTVIVTEDPAYTPGRPEALPRQVSEYFGPLLIALFPVLVWWLVRRRLDGSHTAVFLLYSVVLGAVLSVMWIDTDGGFWIWLTQNRDFTLGRIYTEGDALHHRYVYPPPIAAMLIALRPVFTLFGAMDGITPASLVLSKLAVIPFVVATGLVLGRLEGPRAVLLWAFNSVVLFTVAANSMYFGLAFIITLVLYYVKSNRHYASALTLGLGLAYMSAVMLLVPPFLLLMRPLGVRKIVVMAALVLVPAFIVFLPYTFIDPAGMNMRVMSAGISTWMDMHLGLRIGGVGLTTLLYGTLLGWLWVRRPPFDYPALAVVFSLTALIYLHIGAPYFLAWTVAFQPAIIVSVARSRHEVFYSIYITALMVWGSFFLNTGGAGDRAGETGFFPYYVFYTWPFDVYAVAARLYPRITFFSKTDLEVLSHSISAGVSVVLGAIIVARLARGAGGPAGEAVEGAYE